MIKSNPDFETIEATSSYQDVVDLITKNFEENNELLTVEQAAKLIEDELVEEALKIARIKKIQQRFQPKTEVQQPQGANNTQAKQPQTTTLSNTIGTARRLTARERAIAAMEGRLNK